MSDRTLIAVPDDDDERPAAITVKLYLDNQGRPKLHTRILITVDERSQYWIGDSAQMDFHVFESRVRPALQAAAAALGGTYVERISRAERQGALWPRKTVNTR